MKSSGRSGFLWWVVVLVLMFLAGLLVARDAAADDLDPIPPVEDQICGPWYYQHASGWSNYWGWWGWEDEQDWYCYYQWFGGTVGIHATRAEIIETGVQGFGFTLDRTSQLQPGESNSTFEVIWDLYSFVIQGDVDGLGYEIDLFGDCWYWYGYPPCGYYAMTLTLGDGWVADNGIDFSGMVLQLDPYEQSFGVFAGNGWQGPWWPYDPWYGPFVGDVENELPIEVQLEDFFGITFRIEFEQDRVDVINAPEPGANDMLAAGCLLLVALASRQLKRFDPRAPRPAWGFHRRGVPIQ